MKKIAAFLTAAVLAISVAAPAFGANVKDVRINGEKVEFEDVESEIIGSAVMIPARFVSEAMGLKFAWYPGKQQAEITGEDFKAVITVDSAIMTYTSGGEEKSFKMDGKAVLKNNRMLISENAVREIALQNGFNVLADDVDKTLVITSADSAAAFVNGNKVSFEGCAPAVIDGTAMFPLRFICEAMGLSFNWYSSERIAVISDETRRAQLTAGEKTVVFGSESLSADVKPFLSGNRLYASAKLTESIAEYFGMDADIEGYTIKITLPETYTVTVDGKEPVFRDVLPYENDGLRMIPLRAVAEAAGLKYEWFSADRYTKVYLESAPENYAILKDGSDKLITAENGTEASAELDCAIELKGNRMAVSVDTLGKLMAFFGFGVTANESAVNVSTAEAQNDEGGTVPSSAEEDGSDVKVTYNGEAVEFTDAFCVIRESRTLVPVRCVAETMDMRVDWDEESRVVSISDEGNVLKITIDSAEIVGIKDGSEVNITLEAPAIIINDRTYVPIRAVMEFFGAKVDWDSETGTVIIEKDLPENPANRTVEGHEGLGFTIGVPEGSENILKETVDSAARVSFTYGGARYVFTAVKPGDDFVVDYGSVVGGRLSYAVTVNGTDTSITAASLEKGGVLACWSIDGYSFNLYTPDEISKSDIFKTAAAAAKTFEISPQADLAEDDGESSRPEESSQPVDTQLPNPVKEVSSADEFASVGVAAALPQGGENPVYSIISDNLAQISFILNSNAYVFRGAAADEDISGIYSAFTSEETVDISGVSVTVKRIQDGGSLAMWKIGDISYTLYTPEETTDEAFKAAAEVCVAACGR